jgi:hypothetical protein
LISNTLKTNFRLSVILIVNLSLIAIKPLPQLINDVGSETFEESSPPLRMITVMGTNNNDNYFTIEDLKYYEQKYSKEKIIHKKTVTIR